MSNSITAPFLSGVGFGSAAGRAQPPGHRVQSELKSPITCPHGVRVSLLVVLHCGVLQLVVHGLMPEWRKSAAAEGALGMAAWPWDAEPRCV